MKILKYFVVAAGIAGLLLTASIVVRNKTQNHNNKTVIAYESVTNVNTAQQLEGIIKNNPSVALDIGATWCGPCKEYDPIFEEVAQDYKNVVFCKVTLDKLKSEEETSIIKKYDTKRIPKTILFKKNKEVYNQYGLIKKEDLKELIGMYLLEKNKK